MKKIAFLTLLGLVACKGKENKVVRVSVGESYRFSYELYQTVSSIESDSNILVGDTAILVSQKCLREAKLDHDSLAIYKRWLKISDNKLEEQINACNSNHLIGK